MLADPKDIDETKGQENDARPEGQGAHPRRDAIPQEPQALRPDKQRCQQEGIVAPATCRAEDGNTDHQGPIPHQNYIIVELGADLAHKALQPHVAQEGAGENQDLGKTDGHYIGDHAAEGNEGRRRHLEEVVDHQIGQPLIAVATLSPEQNHHQGADGERAYIGEKNRADVGKAHKFGHF
jgi:hypothetical protein